MMNLKKLLDQKLDVKEVLDLVFNSGNVFLSWGVLGRNSEEELVPNMRLIKNKGVFMKVNGWFWKEYMLISKAKSGYKVRLLTRKKIHLTVSKLTLADIVEAIDKRIEKLPSYKF